MLVYTNTLKPSTVFRKRTGFAVIRPTPAVEK